MIQDKWTHFNAWAKIHQEEYIYLSDTFFNTKENCIKVSYYNCTTMEVLNNNFKHFDEYGCTKNCLPWSLISNYDNNETLKCQIDEEIECAFNVFYNEYFYNSNCSKPCSLVQYSGRIDFWEYKNSNDSSFTVSLRFAPPVKSTVYEEYLIYNFFGMVGSVGGTLGIFIGFSCSNALNFIINVMKKYEILNLRKNICQLCNPQGFKNAISKVQKLTLFKL